MAENQPENRTTSDWIHTGVKAAISAVPVIGSPAAEFFGFLVAAPASKRKDEWIRSLEERLVSLETKIPGLIEALPSNDAFVTATLHATQVAMRSHQTEKLTALRNAVLNVAVGAAPDADRQLIFLTWVDAFTPTHLAVLEAFAPSCPDELRTAVRSRMSSHREFTDAVINDLNARGLLVDHRPYIARNRESSSPLASLSWTLSELATQFLAFIGESPENGVAP
jgi:hypothetical protein